MCTRIENVATFWFFYIALMLKDLRHWIFVEFGDDGFLGRIAVVGFNCRK